MSAFLRRSGLSRASLATTGKRFCKPHTATLVVDCAL